MTGMTGWVVWSFTVAMAQGTGDVSTFPCPDGFLACQVDSGRLSPGLTSDHTGMPVTAGSRLGWFDLRPTDVFDPFRSAIIAPGPTGTPEPVAHPVVETHPVKRPQRPKPRRVPDVVRSPQKDLPTQPDPLPSPPVMCDVVALETRAALGRLSTEERSCLRLGTETGIPTRRSANSRVLMADAFARGATDEHDTLLRYHLERIDQSDPDLAMRQARVSARKGRAMESIRWADTALENSNAWNGPAFVGRMNAAYELRAKVAHDAWQNNANADPLPDREQVTATETSRHLAKTLAREWLDYARSAEVPTRKALDLCRSAGDRAFCR